MKLPPFLLKTMLAALLSVCMAATLISCSPNSTETTETQQQTPSDSSEQTQDPADTDGNDTQDQQSAEDPDSSDQGQTAPELTNANVRELCQEAVTVLAQIEGGIYCLQVEMQDGKPKEYYYDNPHYEYYSEVIYYKSTQFQNVQQMEDYLTRYCKIPFTIEEEKLLQNENGLFMEFPQYGVCDFDLASMQVVRKTDSGYVIRVDAYSDTSGYMSGKAFTVEYLDGVYAITGRSEEDDFNKYEGLVLTDPPGVPDTIELSLYYR